MNILHKETAAQKGLMTCLLLGRDVFNIQKDVIPVVVLMLVISIELLIGRGKLSVFKKVLRPSRSEVFITAWNV